MEGKMWSIKKKSYLNEDQLFERIEKNEFTVFKSKITNFG